MQVNIEEYVDRDEIKRAILDGITSFAKSEAERVISNCGYHVASDVVSRSLGPDAKSKISEKAISILDDLSCFTVFDLGGYGRPTSEARRVLDRVVADNKDLLSSSVRSAMHNLSKSEIVDIVKSGNVKLVIE